MAVRMNSEGMVQLEDWQIEKLASHLVLPPETVLGLGESALILAGKVHRGELGVDPHDRASTHDAFVRDARYYGAVYRAQRELHNDGFMTPAFDVLVQEAAANM